MRFAHIACTWQHTTQQAKLPCCSRAAGYVGTRPTFDLCLQELTALIQYIKYNKGSVVGIASPMRSQIRSPLHQC